MPTPGLQRPGRAAPAIQRRRAVKRLRLIWLRLLGSLWFVPTLVTAGCMSLAVGLVEAGTWVEIDLARDWPLLFGAGANAARSMLSAIATSMITVAGVVFSVTIVALSLASSQYSPRVLRNFMGDRPTQLVLGVFVGIFAYCLVVLRTIRSMDEGDGFMPSLAVVGGLALALCGVAVLIYFIHHVASSIQASSILERIAADTGDAINWLFPQELADDAAIEGAAPAGEDALVWQPVTAAVSGYLVSLDDDRLLDVAREQGRVLRMARPLGDFVIDGDVLVEVSGSAPVSPELQRRMRSAFTLGPQRDVHQDAAYGLQQLVDVALKALSPGVNDRTTAVMCIDRIAALLARLASRRMPAARRSDGPVLRVIARTVELEDLLALALDPITEHARGDSQVLGRLLWALGAIERRATEGDRRAALLRRLSLVQEGIRLQVASPVQQQGLLLMAEEIEARLRHLPLWLPADPDGAARGGHDGKHV
jgi:uncharacterized membrane protein